MVQSRLDRQVTRRQALRLGGGLAGGLMVASSPLLATRAAAAEPRASAGTHKHHPLPVKQIEEIIRVQGTVSNGVLNIEVDRNDLPHVVTSSGTPIKPSFEINGNVCFQDYGDGSAVLNLDPPVKSRY